MLKKVIIAIDGPAGSGKSTAAKNIAQNLDFIYLDTGAMYRAITYLALRNGIVENIPAVIELTQKISLKVKFENNVTRVFVDDEEITDNIRTPDVNSKVSEISTIPEVRSELVKIQKKLGEEGDIVAEGRDVTTVVFPYADVKIFMTASVEERAKRRFKEFQEKKADITLAEVKENIEKRDKIDSERSISPLKKADDAIEFDNTGLSITDELDLLLNIIKNAQLKTT